MYYVRSRRILVASPDDHLFAGLWIKPLFWTENTIYLSLNSYMMSGKSRKRVHIDAYLRIHERNVFTNHIIKFFQKFRHVESPDSPFDG